MTTYSWRPLKEIDAIEIRFVIGNDELKRGLEAMPAGTREEVEALKRGKVLDFMKAVLVIMSHIPGFDGHITRDLFT